MERTLRRPEAVGEIALTARDILWLRAAHRFRFITTDQAQIMSGSTGRKGVNKRLATLFAHQYLDRPVVQRAAYSHAEKRHTVHTLGQQGAKWLATHDGVQFPKGKGWTSANAGLSSSERLQHQIGVVDTVLRLERTMRETEGLHLIHPEELLVQAPEWPPKLKQHRLPTQVTQQGRVVDRGTDPDYTFAIAKEFDGKVRRALCFLEWDNSSEDFIKSNRLASAIGQKHYCYVDAYKRKLQTKLYGLNNFRVLFVINGPEDRVTRMQQVFDRTVKGQIAPSVFLYATNADFMSQGPLSDIWINGAGERVALI